jgi:radical SAM protein with 4Fe4S-binding SPASM domain
MTTASAALPTDYGPLVRELHRRAAARRQPVNGTFELTERCNLACRMCYVCQAPGDAARRAKELSAAAWLELARQAVDNGMVFLLLTGGEVFLRPDFFELYTPLTRLGLILTLFTNGTLITEALAERLAEAPPGRTEITLYGATAATYEAVTGVPGSYARCCAGIEALVKHRVPLGLKNTITRQNVSELDAMRQMAHNWGLPFSAGWLLSKRRDGALSEVADCRLSASECVALEATDRASATEWTEAALRESSLGHDRNFYCQAGQAAFVVNPAGEMNACIDLPFPAARPLEIGFRAAWEQVQRFVDSAPPLAPLCLACDARAYCPRCPAWSQLEAGTLTEPVPYLCEIARSRRERYVQPA